MLDHDSPYEDRSQDLIARVRKMREAAREQMDRFGKPEEYDVEILHGRKSPPDVLQQTAVESAAHPDRDGAKP
jgi:hypothetical protein